MKTQTILFGIAMLFSAASMAGHPTNQLKSGDDLILLDSVSYYDYNSDTDEWEYAGREQIIFDENNICIADNYKEWDPETKTLVLSAQKFYKTDAKGNLTKIVSYESETDLQNGSTWEGKYDEAGRIIEKQYGSFYNGDTTSITLVEKETRAFDANGNLLQEAGYSYSSPEWVLRSKRENKYENNLLVESKVFTWNYYATPPAVELTAIYTYEYDASGNKKMLRSESVPSGKLDSTKYSYEISGNDTVINWYQIGSDNNWYLYEKTEHTYTDDDIYDGTVITGYTIPVDGQQEIYRLEKSESVFDDRGNPIIDRSFFLNPSTQGVSKGESKSTHTYYPDLTWEDVIMGNDNEDWFDHDYSINVVKEEVHYDESNSDIDEWLPSNKDVYHYRTKNLVSTPEIADRPFISPNPVCEYLSVQAAGAMSIQIVTLAGLTVMEQNIADNEILQTGTLEAGCYVYAIRTADGILQGSFVKE